MKVAGVDPAQVQQYAAALQEYHAESMNQIVIDAESSWASMMREMREFKADWASMWKGASDTAIDEIVRFAKEGKFEFGNLVDYVLEQMLRIELQKSLVQPMSEVMNMGKFALSGMFGSTSGYTQGLPRKFPPPHPLLPVPTATS
ncbi:hypothetical protein HSBAA_29720 [Vreelandella sulfidaeris]|uniref:Bacteriophage tail tape measure C-terminal domain-containing protein n=1 Tax=Vreelandella sulfidaeris TaxID=115553 RepID=A0A455U6B9_9GAMM|nr:hypothetical protein HSBAA_29720 [Halomonas sulfidaeris]